MKRRRVKVARTFQVQRLAERFKTLHERIKELEIAVGILQSQYIQQPDKLIDIPACEVLEPEALEV